MNSLTSGKIYPLGFVYYTTRIICNAVPKVVQGVFGCVVDVCLSCAVEASARRREQSISRADLPPRRAAYVARHHSIRAAIPSTARHPELGNEVMSSISSLRRPPGGPPPSMADAHERRRRCLVFAMHTALYLSTRRRGADYSIGISAHPMSKIR